MDVHKALRELYEEKKRLDRAILALEANLKKPGKAPRRGRKRMSPEERLAVSKRMSAYWAARRAAKMQHPAEETAQQQDSRAVVAQAASA